MVCELTYAVVEVAGVALLVPRYGLVGAAYATIISTAVKAVMSIAVFVRYSLPTLEALEEGAEEEGVDTAAAGVRNSAATVPLAINLP